MEIRSGTREDIPSIVGLLKVSLGESLLPKSEAYWDWKHNQNPFGRSPVLLATQDGNIIGVRAFMNWEWKLNGKVIKAVRAVDTATHPEYQGKGIFKKLTLSLVKQCEENGIDLIYNTPNKKSQPGYLKMEWKAAGKLPLDIRLVRPLSIGIRLILPVDQLPMQENKESISYYLSHPGLENLLQHSESRTANITTAYSVEYLKWRYESVPILPYQAFGIETNEKKLKGLVIYRLKNSKLGRELRITDVFCDATTPIKQLKEILKEKIQSHRIDYVTCSTFASETLLKGILTFSNWTLGPMVTVRSLNSTSLDPFISFKQWLPSVGDLELF